MYNFFNWIDDIKKAMTKAQKNTGIKPPRVFLLLIYKYLYQFWLRLYKLPDARVLYRVLYRDIDYIFVQITRINASNIDNSTVTSKSSAGITGLAIALTSIVGTTPTAYIVVIRTQITWKTKTRTAFAPTGFTPLFYLNQQIFI